MGLTDGTCSVGSRQAPSAIMAIIMIASMLSGVQVMPAEGAGGSFGGGSGTLDDPYIVEDVWDLQNISSDLKAHYALGNDIDASATAGWNSGAGFMPLANGSYPSVFKGSFDGRNHTITGLFIDRPAMNVTSLFGFVYYRGYVRNVALSGCDVTGHCRVGALVGDLAGVVSNCRADGNVTGESFVGGLVGQISSGTVGAGSAVGPAGAAGGGATAEDDGTVSGSHFTGNVSASDVDAGGLVGNNLGGTIQDSHAAANVTGECFVGGLAGECSGPVPNSHYPIDSTLINGAHNLTLGGLYEAQYEDWASSGYALDISDYDGTLVPEDGCYGIGTVQGLRDLLGFADDDGRVFRLASDIDLAAHPFTYVPYLGADFDGAGHNVSNLRLEHTYADCVGLFGFCWFGAVSNVSVVGCQVRGPGAAGGLVGLNEGGAISACNVTGNVTGVLAGGLVGSNYFKASIKGSHASVATTGQADGFAGGLVAHNRGTVSSSYATGPVRGVEYVGGLLGFSYLGIITDCHATGDVAGERYVGGLLGYLFFGTFNRSYATGNVTGTDQCVGGLVGYGECGPYTYATGNVTGPLYVGGLVGYYIGKGYSCYATGKVNGSDCVGGLIGYLARSGIYWSYAEGDVTGDGSWVGGFVGYNGGTVTDSYARGAVTNSSMDGSCYGGFVGMNYRGKVQNCYSTGAVVNVGVPDPTDRGFAGGVDTGGKYNMTGDFWDNRTSGQTGTAGAAIGRSTREMMEGATFTGAGWDFNGVWTIREGRTYPLLWWQAEVDFYAEAGPDQYVDPGTLVRFNGSDSADPDGIVNYTWTPGEGTAWTLHGAQASREFDDYGIYPVRLTVTNKAGKRTSDTMTVFVMEHVAPVAEAGPNQTVDEGTLVAFDGTGSTDDVRVAAWTWTFVDGRGVRLAGSRPTYLFDNPGTFEVTLWVTDECGNRDADVMTVTVNDTTPPEADAGPDQSVDEDTLVAFNGTASRDNVGIANYTWTFFDGAPVALYGACPNHTFNDPGAFNVTLNVTDAAGNWATATTNVTVNDTTAPVAEAGPDQVVDEGDTVLFNGTGSADNLGVAGYNWTFLDGSPVALDGPKPSHRFDGPGTFVVTLNVTDAAGHWATDAMTVTVRDVTSPEAEAGPDQVVDEGTVVTFDGGASSDNVGVADWTWTFTDVALVTLHGARPAYLFDNPGVFAVTLNATDDAGNWGTDTVTITVRDITPPVADAGPDRTVDAGTLVTLDGSGSSDNVGVVNLSWSFTDGPAVELHGAAPSYRFRNLGVFAITLTVADAAGNLGTGAATITVEDLSPPVAEAGPDRTVDEGEPVTLNASGSSDNVGIVNWTWTLSYDGQDVRTHDATLRLCLAIPGTYTAHLEARDAAGHQGSDDVVITVVDVLPPRVEAGPDRTVDEGAVVGFDGSESSDTGGIANFTWTFEHGGKGVALYGPEAAFTFDVPGSYRVTLEVTDAAGHSGSDTANITVRDVRPPTADAGPDRTVDENAPVTFDGSGSSDTAGVASYTWSFRYGQGDIALHGVSPSFTFETPGVYAVRLNVTDAAGHWAADDMVLTVRDVTPPVADAGPDRTVPAGRAVALDGSPSTDNAGIANYTWTFTYGGKPVTLDGASRSYTFAEGGVYEVSLTVSDTSGNLDEDTVAITVVDMGRVTGTVHDKDGRPVGGATIEINASDGRPISMTTGANGSFAMDVHNGAFTWKITKDGYDAISGSGTVSAMGATELNIPDLPLVRVEGRGPSTALLLTAAIVVIVTVAVAAALVLRRRNREGSLER